MKILFWVCLVVLFYTYVGYPLMLRLFAGRKRSASAMGAFEPAVTLLVSAYNEEAVIREKLENSLSLDYPADRLEVIVISDASDDRTDELVAGFTDSRVRLLRMPERGGKTAGLNRAVPLARGQIVVFSDANAIYDRNAIRAIVSPFADGRVGAVTGEQRYHAAGEGTAGESEGFYWRYEQSIKRLESDVASVVGGDGAIYAIRKELYQPMRPEDISDFINPLQIVLAGYRNVYQPDAFAFEHSGDSDLKEFRRKTRIVNQAFRATMQYAQLLNPLRHGIFAVQLISHKLLRWLALLPLLGLAVSSYALHNESLFYAVAFWAQVLAYGLALVGLLLVGSKTRPRVVSVPYYFVLVNVASIVGIVENLFGKRYATWTTVREREESAPN